MPSFRREELEQSVYGSATNVQRSHLGNQRGDAQTVGEAQRMPGRRDRRTAEQNMALIKTFIAEAGRPVLLLEICDHLGRKPSPHLRSILTTLVATGEVVQTQDYGAGPVVPRFWYSLPE